MGKGGGWVFSAVDWEEFSTDLRLFWGSKDLAGRRKMGHYCES